MIWNCERGSLNCRRRVSFLMGVVYFGNERKSLLNYNIFLSLPRKGI